MTDISKEAVDALLQGVTEGPWHVGRGDGQWFVGGGGFARVDMTGPLGDHEANALFIAAARELVPALRAALDEAEAALTRTEANRDAVLADLNETVAERDAAIAAARIAHDALWELNPNNYDHDEVCKVNDGSVEAILTLAPIIGETHGKPPEWWAERAAHLGAKP